MSPIIALLIYIILVSGTTERHKTNETQGPRLGQS